MDEIEKIAKTIIEFYNAGSEQTRKNLGTSLEEFCKGQHSWRLAIELIKPERPMHVQFYAAHVIYFNIEKNFHVISENLETIEFLKNFLVQKLSTCVHSLSHSVLNKLTSGLALFILKSMPDIWADPFKELIMLWTNQLELLLRVFAEIPSEFQRLNVSLDHRSRVRSVLQNATKDIIQIDKHVFDDHDSPPSLRNAAIECFESWLKLPGTNLLDFIPIINAVFTNIGNDMMALARIIGTLKTNDEIRNLPQLVWEITEVIAKNVCPIVQTELQMIFSDHGENSYDRMEDFVPLICTMVEYTHDYSSIILDKISKDINDQSIINIYLALSHFFLQISNLPGQYPAQECLSDLPEPWWYSLREELLQPDDGSTWSEGKRLLRDQAANWYIDMLKIAITKLAHTPEIDLLDKEAIERFKTYRKARSDIALNAIQMTPYETIKVLSENLHAALNAYDPDRSEAVIHLITEASDFIKESQINSLTPAILKCGTLEDWAKGNIPPQRMVLFGRTFLNFIKATEHHLLSCRNVQQIMPALVQIILSYLQLAELTKSSFDTLLTIMGNRDDAIKLTVDRIIHSCYHYFANIEHSEDTRLLAMRCVGMGLSFKEPEIIIESLNQILVPSLAELEKLSTLQTALMNGQMEKANFELSVVAQLVATLEVHQHQTSGSNERQHPIEDNVQKQSCQSPVKCILTKTLPLLNNLLSNNQPSAELTFKICQVLDAGLQSLYTEISPLLNILLNFLDAIIEIHPVPACELAKKIFLTFHKQSPNETPELVKHLSKWFSARSFSIILDQPITYQGPNELDEKLIELAYHVAKKFWNCIEFASTYSQMTGNDVAVFFQSLFTIIASIIEKSRDTSLIQQALRTLELTLKNFTINENVVLVKSIENTAERVISIVFLSIQNDATITTNLNLIASILYLYTTKYPAQTRSIIQRLPGGDSQFIRVMFDNHSLKNFRMRVLQMHQAIPHQRV